MHKKDRFSRGFRIWVLEVGRLIGGEVASTGNTVAGITVAGITGAGITGHEMAHGILLRVELLFQWLIDQTAGWP